MISEKGLNQRRKENGVGWGEKKTVCVQLMRTLIGCRHMVLPSLEAGAGGGEHGSWRWNWPLRALHRSPPRGRRAGEQRLRETGAEKGCKGCGLKSWPWKSPYMLKSVMWFWEEGRRRKKIKHVVLVTEMLCLNNEII